MKKLVLTILLPIIFSCNSQNIELQEKIDDQIAELQNIIELNSIKISADPIPEKDLSKSINAFKDKKSYHPSFFDSLNINTGNRFPNSYFHIEYDEYRLSELLGHDNLYFRKNAERLPKFEIQKVFYMDGTNENASSAILTHSESNKIPFYGEEDKEYMVNSGLYFFQKNTKPISAVEIKVITNFANIKDYPIDKNTKTIHTDQGDIEILTFNGNELTYKIPISLSEKVEVNALYKNGKYLNSTGSQSFRSTHEIEKIRDLIKILEVAKDKISKEELNTEKELEQFFKSQVKPKDLKTEEYITHSEYFSATISQAVISTIEADKPIVHTNIYPIHQFLKEQYNETGYVICRDAKSNRKGIIGFDGKWLVEPIYYNISQTNFLKNYVQVALKEGEGSNTTFWIDKKNRRLVKTNYDINSYSLRSLHPVLVIMESLNEKLNELGVANNETGELIIPIEFDRIEFSKGTVICTLPNQKTIKIFDETGKLIKTQLKK